jgi:hypothetical protein
MGAFTTGRILSSSPYGVKDGAATKKEEFAILIFRLNGRENGAIHY